MKAIQQLAEANTSSFPPDHFFFLMETNFTCIIESECVLQLRYFHNQGQIQNISSIKLARLRSRMVGRKKNATTSVVFPPALQEFRYIPYPSPMGIRSLEVDIWWNAFNSLLSNGHYGAIMQIFVKNKQIRIRTLIMRILKWLMMVEILWKLTMCHTLI